MPRLSAGGILEYLLRKGLVSRASIVEGDLKVVETRSRNSNYQVISRNGPCYLIKHGPVGGSVSTVAAESAIYSLAWRGGSASRLRPYLPRFYDYDEGADLLVLELYPNAETLLEYHGKTGRFSTAYARQLADALSMLHGLRPESLAEMEEASRGTPALAEALLSQSKEPWALAIHHPGLEMLGDMSAASVQFVSTIQQYAPFEELLDRLRGEWRGACLVHGDVKWANCLLHRSGSGGRAAQLKLVDWEFAGWGDPCWDVGSVFADYLNFWLLSMPVGEQVEPAELWGLARYPIERMQPALGAFWDHYCLRSGLGPVPSLPWLVRSVRYAAVRLLQLGFEQSQYTSQLSNNTILLLQLSLNMLQQPGQAMQQLLGLPRSIVGIPSAVSSARGAQ